MTDDVTELENEIFKEDLAKDVYEACQDIFKPIHKLIGIINKIIANHNNDGHEFIVSVRDAHSGLRRELERMAALYFELKDKE